MTQLFATTPQTADSPRSPHWLTVEEARTARSTYERLGHHRYLHWNDLPDWQRAGYHRLAMVDQVAAMRRVQQLSSAIDSRHDALVAAVAESVSANGWQLLLLSYCAPPMSSPEGEQQFHVLVREVLRAAADHLTPRPVIS